MPQEKKVYLNIQEQVEKNKKDILDIQQGATVLADFGIRVIGQVDEESELPDPAEYEGEFGDAYAVGTEAPYDFYIFTRAFEGQDEPSWFNIGEFPVPGPQGETGPAGQNGSNGRGIVSIAKTSTSGLEDTYTITYTDGTTSSYVVKNGANGQAAAIQSVTATVDSGTGTPSVEVSLGGTEQSRSFAFAFHNLRGAQGETGDPGSFIIAGQVTTDSLLPDASVVEPKYIYLVGSASPYDVYAIVQAGDVKSWINLGPIAVTISDTKVGANAWNTSGTLALEVLTEIVNTPTMDFIRIGDRYFVKHSAGHYYALKRDSGVMLVYGMTIDLSTGEWTIVTETMVDLDSDQAISGIKTFLNELRFTYDSSKYSTFHVKANKVLYLKISGTDYFSFSETGLGVNGNLTPFSNNAGDLGSSSNKWKDLYLSGKIKDGTNEWNFDSIGFPVISKPASTTLTADEVATISKGAVFNGSSSDKFLDYEKIVFFTLGDTSFGENGGFALCVNGFTPELRMYKINSSNVISIIDATTKRIRLQSIAQINGKNIPDYPTTNTEKQVPVIAPNGGALSWEDKPTTLYKHTIRDGGPNYGWVIISTDSTQFDIASQASYAALRTYLVSKNIISFYDSDNFAPIKYNYTHDVFEIDTDQGDYDDFVLSGATDTVTKL